MGWGWEGRVMEEEHGRITNIKDSLKATCEPTTIEVFQIHTHIHTQKEFKYLIMRTNTLTTYNIYIITYNRLPNKNPKRKGLPLGKLLAFTVP